MLKQLSILMVLVSVISSAEQPTAPKQYMQYFLCASQGVRNASTSTSSFDTATGSLTSINPLPAQPFDYVVVYDTSAQDVAARPSNYAAARYILTRVVRPQHDRGAVVLTSTKLFNSWQGFTSDSSSLLEHISAVRAAGQSAIYDGIMSAAHLFPWVSSKRPRVIFVISDGAQDSSRSTREEMLALVRDTHAILVTFSFSAAGSRATHLDGLAEETGGIALQLTAANSLADLERRNQTELTTLRRAFQSWYVIQGSSGFGNDGSVKWESSFNSRPCDLLKTTPMGVKSANIGSQSSVPSN